MNVFAALLFGIILEADSNNNQCVWYLVGFLSDIFFCTFLNVALTSFVRPLFRNHCGIDIGDYEGHGAEQEDDRKTNMQPWLMWSLQVAIWLGILTCVKAVVTLGVYLGENLLYTALAMCFHMSGLCGHQRAQLVASVIVVPIIGDAFQFAVQDSFLKKKQVEGSPEKSEDLLPHVLQDLLPRALRPRSYLSRPWLQQHQLPPLSRALLRQPGEPLPLLR